jgi:hypothetical protein
MKYKLTSQQVARRSRPDAERGNEMYLLKNVTSLRATYQIRLLTYRAVEEQMRLVIRVPKACKIHESLRTLAEDNSRYLKIERVK